MDSLQRQLKKLSVPIRYQKESCLQWWKRLWCQSISYEYYYITWSSKLSRFRKTNLSSGMVVLRLKVTHKGEIIDMCLDDEVAGLGLEEYMIRKVTPLYSRLWIQLPYESPLIPFYRSCNVYIHIIGS